jgi:hypothetical protein
MAVIIREHHPAGDISPFLDAAREVFRDDPHWVQPLDFDMKTRLHPRKNPFFKRAEVTLFTAWRDGKVVGRCSAQIDREHLRVWKDDTGFFGFFDTIDDEEVARRLIEAASAWLSRRGMKRMIGPMSLYVNEEIGVLVDGFDVGPSLMMAHSRPYQGALLEKVGLEKEKDLLAFRYRRDEGFPERVLKAHAEVMKMPEVRLRSVDTKNLAREMDAIMDIYNDAWQGKWCFVPALPDETKKVVADLRLLIDKDMAFMAEVNGKPMGMCIMLPNLNEVIADFKGKLSVRNVAKLLYRLKWRHPKSTRLMMLGIKSELRQGANLKKYAGLSAAMYVEVAKRGIAKGYQWSELSWTREDDAPVNLGIRSMGGKQYKRYRVFRKALEIT